MAWVDRYERAWRDGDVDAVADLFAVDAVYLRSPYAPPDIGVEAIRGFWLEDDDDVFRMRATPVAVDGRDAVVRVEVHYGDPVSQEYRDLWVLRFGTDGLVEEFEEWPYWPGKPFAASGA